MNPFQSSIGLMSLVALFVASGCATYTVQSPDSKVPLDIPDQWHYSQSAASVESWFEDIDVPELFTLISEAVGQNFDLQSVSQRVEAARFQAQIAGAARLPQIDVSATGSRDKRSGVNNTSFVDNPSNQFRLQGQVNWEADIWGRLSDATKAAYSDFEVARANFEAARLSLAANVARQWFNLIEAKQQASLAQETVDSFNSSLDIIESQYRRGIGDALDVHLARSNLATAQANLQLRRRETGNAARVLQILLGRYPDGRLQIPVTLPEIRRSVPAGLPSQLLERRPDLIAAELELRASGYRFLEASKNRLPRLQLTANTGTSSDELRELVDIDFLVWSLIGNVVQPIFQGGRLQAERELAEAREKEALNRYAQAILTAFQEVETALDSESFLWQQVEALDLAATEAQAAEELAVDQYRRGLTNIVTLLESQRRAFNARSSFLAVSNQRLQNRINLYLALGGDFHLKMQTTDVE